MTVGRGHADGAGVDPDRLRAVELFAGLTDEQIAWVATQGTPMSFEDGTVLFEDGDDGDYFYVLLAGGLLFTKVINGEEQVMSRNLAEPDGTSPVPGDKPAAASQFTGELPMLAGGAYVARGTAIGHTETMAYDRAEFFAMLARCPQMCHVLLPVLAWKIRSYEHQSGRSVMLEGLGTLAAGLAHELNNPTAALIRAAQDLTCVAGRLAEWAVRWGDQATPAERAALGGLDLNETVSDPLTAAVASDEIIDLLDERGVGEPGALAFTLADCGFDAEALRSLEVRAEAFEAAVSFLAYSAQIRMLAGEVTEGGHRIGNLINSVKGYTNVGRAPLQDVRLAEGVDATLAMMAPKLHGIRVRREYAELPLIPGCPGELNQVWTNLIENAVDAMEGSGKLIVRIFREGDSAVVEFRDSGPGIPPEVMPRLFQPFFTTKDIGKGTGLGLHLSRDIVVHRHKGHLDVASVPGDTEFRVYLPMPR